MDPLNEEQWADVEGNGDRYQVSSFGRVKSKPYLRTGYGRNGVFNWTTESKVLKQQRNPDGYLAVTLCRDTTRRTVTVHRLVAITFLPNEENLPHVNHKDSNRANNHVNNLEWSTIQDNVIHSFEQGNRCNKGESNPRSILNWEVVRKIRHEIACGKKMVTIAKEVGVSGSMISRIWKGLAWKE